MNDKGADQIVRLNGRIQRLLSEWVNGGIQIPLKAAGHHYPPAKHHLNGVSLTCQLCQDIESWLGNFVIFQRIQTSNAKKPWPIFFYFSGGGWSRLPPPPPTPTYGMCRLIAICLSHKDLYTTLTNFSTKYI